MQRGEPFDKQEHLDGHHHLHSHVVCLTASVNGGSWQPLLPWSSGLPRCKSPGEGLLFPKQEQQRSEGNQLLLYSSFHSSLNLESPPPLPVPLSAPRGKENAKNVNASPGVCPTGEQRPLQWSCLQWPGGKDKHPNVIRQGGSLPRGKSSQHLIPPNCPGVSGTCWAPDSFLL